MSTKFAALLALACALYAAPLSYTQDDEDAGEQEPVAMVALNATRTETAPASGLAALLDLDAAGGELGERIDDPDDLSLHLDVLPYFLVALGEHRRAMAVEQAFRTAIELPLPPRTEASPFGEVHAVSAVETILAAARDRRVVMLNEEHRSSLQRALLGELIDGFADLGFTHLSVEALDFHALSAIEEGGYVLGDQGPYLRDPTLAFALRRARERGLVLFAHDQVHRGVRPVTGIADRMARDNYREACAALNLADLLEADPKARVVVYAGRGHIYEADADEWIPLGARLAKLAKLDPLSIECTKQVAYQDPAFESNAYHHADALHLLGAAPVVLVDENAVPWSNAPGAVDIDVFFPRPVFEPELGGRANFLRIGGRRQPVAVELDRPALASTPLAGPALLFATPAGAPAGAVPSDQVVLWPGMPTPSLLLAPGTYTIQVVDRAGTVLFAAQRKVE